MAIRALACNVFADSRNGRYSAGIQTTRVTIFFLIHVSHRPIGYIDLLTQCNGCGCLSQESQPLLADLRSTYLQQNVQHKPCLALSFHVRPKAERATGLAVGLVGGRCCGFVGPGDLNFKRQVPTCWYIGTYLPERYLLGYPRWGSGVDVEEVGVPAPLPFVTCANLQSLTLLPFGRM